MTQSPQTNAKGFSKAFWVSNTVELFERMAYYAVFIVLTIYLSNILGFNDFEASMISGLFSGGLYLLPIFTGAYADKIGFRKSMIIAFSLLSAGYLGLGVLPTLYNPQNHLAADNKTTCLIFPLKQKTKRLKKRSKQHTKSVIQMLFKSHLNNTFYI